MSLMDFFRPKQTELVQPTAVDYVDWLIKHMLGTSKTELSLDSRRPLPGSDLVLRSEEAPPCLPDPRVVINRLKVLAGVSPVCQAKNVVGVFEQPRGNCTVEVSATFLDSAEHAACTLRLRVRRRTT